MIVRFFTIILFLKAVYQHIRDAVRRTAIHITRFPQTLCLVSADFRNDPAFFQSRSDIVQLLKYLSLIESVFLGDWFDGVEKMLTKLAYVNDIVILPEDGIG